MSVVVKLLNMKKAIILLVVLFLTGCATLVVKDANRQKLYNLKTSWQEIHTCVITQTAEGRIYGKELVEFNRLKETFNTYFDIALTLYLARENKTPDFQDAIEALEDVLHEARQKYMN